ncbi:MAG: SLBB domain-containing protein [Proteobacteria bacterium]|nr:SLBB domain-containing protein [Pseudomonadota bacterium]
MNVFLKSASRHLGCSSLSHVRATIVSAARACLKGLLLTAIFVSMGVSAQTISPQMIQQLQSMPPAQQEAMAKQYGIDLDQVLGRKGVKGTNTGIAAPGEQLEQRTLGDTDLESQQNYRLFQEKFAEFEKSLIEEKGEVQRYGVSLFDKEVSTFAPTDDASVPDNYRLGAGDQLAIQLFGSESDQYDLQITRDGQISFPKLGPITVAGLTYEDARELIQSRVKDQIIGAQATISMGRLRAINIFMAGEVAVPGAYSVSALTTITQALFQAGGIGDIGSLRNIQVKRNGLTVETFDVYQLLLKGDASGDVRLQSGDVVFVPPYAGIVDVEGAVKRPMIYEFIDGESVADAVAMAGGLNQDAYSAAIAVVSKAIGKSLPGAKNIDLTQAERETTGLRDGDKIRVPQSTENLENAVTLKGAVVRPGVYGWVVGQKIADILSSIPSDLKPYADLGYALVVRQKNAQLDIEVLQINLATALNGKGSQDNILTRPRDQIIVFSQASVSDITTVDADADADTDTEAEAEITSSQRLALLRPIIEKLKSQARSGEPVQTISISGAVKSPGDYPLSRDDTVATLIAAGGGLQDSVYLDSAELRRLYLGQNNEILSRYIDLNLTTELMSSSGTVLQSRDHLYVRALPDWNPTNAVTVEGEVLFPGSYRIRKNETMTDVIERAGGLTASAFYEGAVFTRESVAKQESLRSKEFAQSIIRDFASSQLTKEDNTVGIDEIKAIADTLEKFEGAGRLLVDIGAAMSGDSVADITLEDGDTLTIPPRVSTVTVVGEIRRPGTHSFQSELDLEDYLGLSAGLTARADDKELYIVRADGSVLRPTKSWTLFAGGNTSLNPGDTIVVPINTGYTDNLTLWRDITQTIFNTTAGFASMIAVTK